MERQVALNPRRRIKVLMVLFGAILFGFAWAQQTPQSNKDLEMAKLRQELKLYKAQQLTLNAALAKSKTNEAEAMEKVKELSTRLQALGMYDGDKNERLLQAVADGRVLNQQLTDLRFVTEESMEVFKKFVKLAQVHDPKHRQDAEVALRKLELALWGEKKKGPQGNRTGTLQEAKVISIDSKSGMLVLNLGQLAGSKVGMTFKVSRGGRVLGEGVVEGVRKNVSGLLITSRANDEVVFRVGDSAQLRLQK